MPHTPTIKLIPLCLGLTSCTGLCAPTGTYEFFPEDMGNGAPDLRAQDMRDGKDAPPERDIKEMGITDLGRIDQGGKDLGDMCIPTTTSDDEDWLCDGIDNDCDGIKDEYCCMNGQRSIRSVEVDKSTEAILKIESLQKNINNKHSPEIPWQVQYKTQEESTPLQLILSNHKGFNNLTQETCRNVQFINKSQKINISNQEEKLSYIYNCPIDNGEINTLERFVIDNEKRHLDKTILYKNEPNSYTPFQITISPNMLYGGHIYITPTSNEKQIWLSTLKEQTSLGSSQLSSCLTDITLTKEQLDQRGNTCTITQSHTVDDNTIHINSTNYSPSKYNIHYMYDSDKISYTSPDANSTPPILNINTYTAPTIITDKTKTNEDNLIIVTDSNIQNNRNTLNLYTVNFGQEITQAPIELLPRNNLNQWPAITEIDRDGVKGAEKVALVWQQDKRLMLAIFDPYNPGTISPKAITPQYPTATNIISSIASDDKGLGIAWTVEGETPQQIYYQAISFNGDFICPAP